MSIPYRWIIVAAGALMTCVAIGAMFSLAIFQEPIATETGWSHAGIASAMTLNFIVMGIGGFLWGTASDRFGARVVVRGAHVVAGGAAFRLRPVERTVADNCQQPRFRIAPTVGTEGTKRPQERFLDNVVRGDRIARKKAREAVSRVQIWKEKVLESLSQADPVRR